MRSGKLIPPQAKHLKGRSVGLRPQAMMDWHSTSTREEVLLAVSGTVDLEVQGVSGRIARVTLSAGCCAFLSEATVHRVVNRSTTKARYVYLTAG